MCCTLLVYLRLTLAYCIVLMLSAHLEAAYGVVCEVEHLKRCVVKQCVTNHRDVITGQVELTQTWQAAELGDGADMVVTQPENLRVSVEQHYSGRDKQGTSRHSFNSLCCAAFALLRTSRLVRCCRPSILVMRFEYRYRSRSFDSLSRPLMTDSSFSTTHNRSNC